MRCRVRMQITAFGIFYPDFISGSFPEGFQQGNPVFVASAPGLISELHLMGIRTNQRNRMQFVDVQRKKLFVVLQQDDRFFGQFACQRHLFGSMQMLLERLSGEYTVVSCFCSLYFKKYTFLITVSQDQED